MSDLSAKSTSTVERGIGARPDPVVAALRAGGRPALVDAARSVASGLAERADEYDRLARYPKESIDELWHSGLWALSIPEEFGGIGASLADASEVAKIVGGADASVALIYLWHVAQLRMANAYWPEQWRDRMNADAPLGPVANALRVEPELGTPTRGGVPATKAVRALAPDGLPAWRLNGTKIFSTGSNGLQWMGVWAATTEEDEGGVQVGTFLVPKGTPGVEIVEGSWNHLGIRASASHDVQFHDVLIPIDNVVGLTPFTGVDAAFSRPDPAGTTAWVSVIEASINIGVVKAARDFFVRFLNERAPTNLGAPLATLDRFQQAVGEIELAIYENETLVANIARRGDELAAGADAAPIGRSELGLVKVATSRNAVRAIELAISLIGNPGLSANDPLQRHYRDALCSRAHTPQADMVLGGTGKAALAGGAP